MRVHLGILLALALLLVSCGGGGSQPAPIGGGNPTGGTGGSAAFVTNLVVSSLEVNPDSVVLLKATTSATIPSFVWTAQGGQILAQQDGVENGRPFSIAWWRAPSTSGAVYTLRVTVNSPQGVDTASALVQVNPTTGTFFGSWKSYHNTPESTGLSTPSVVAPSTLNLVWKRPLGGVSRSSPAVITEADASDGVSGALYVGDNSGLLSAINADSGALLWQQSLDSEVATSPLVADGKVFAVTLNGTVYSFDAKSGASYWSFQTGSAVTSTPIYSNGVLVTATQGGTIYALRTQKVILTRTERIWWQKTIDGNHFGASAAVSEPILGFEDPRKAVVAIASQEGNVFAVRLSDGATLWQKSVGSAIINKPVVFTYGAQRLIGVGAEDGRIILLDSDTGAPFQNNDPFIKVDSPVASALVHSNGSLLFTTRDNHLYELNLVNGLVVLNVVVGSGIRCTITPAVGTVAGSSSHNIYYSCFEIVLSGVTNNTPLIRGTFLRVGSEPPTSLPRVLSTYDTGFLQVPNLPLQPPDSLVTAPAIYNGMVMFAGLDGAVYALGPAITAPATPPNWPSKRLSANNQAYFPPGPGRGLLSPKWTFATGSRITASPIVANNALYIGAYDGGLYSLRASDGTLLWRFQADGDIRATALLNNNHLAFGALDAYLYYLNINENRVTDQERFLQEIATHNNVILKDDGQGNITPVVPPFNTSDFLLPRNTILVDTTRSVTGYVDSTLNNTLWPRLHAQWTTTTTILPDGTTNVSTSVEDAGPALINLDNPQNQQVPDLSDCLWTASVGNDQASSAIFIGCLPGYNPEDGGVGSTPELVSLATTNPASRRWGNNARLQGSTGMILGAPAVADGIVFVTTDDGRLYFFDEAATSGAPTNLLPGITTPFGPVGGIRGSVAVLPDGNGTSGRFFFGADDGTLYGASYSRAGTINVTELWRFHAADGIWGSPAIDPVNNLVYFGSNDHRFYSLDLVTGGLVWDFRSNSRFISSPVVTGGAVFEADEGGTVYAFTR